MSNSTHIKSRVFLKVARTPERMLLNRIVLLCSLLGLIMGLLWFDRDGLKDQIDGHISFPDVVYFTAVTVSTVGYGDIVPVTHRARLIDAVLLTPLRLMIWLIFLGTAHELVLQRWLENRRMKHLQNTLSGHLIVCGYGHSGESAAREVVARGTPPGQVLILDRDKDCLKRAAEEGFIGLLGEATQEQALLDAGINRAKAVLVCVGRDDTATLTVLTIRQIHSTVRVICNVEEEENIKLIRQAGADAVVAPAIVGGHLMADSVQSSHIADYVNDLIRIDGRVYLDERLASARDVGKPMRDLGPGLAVKLQRGNEVVGFWEGDRAIVQAGDRLLEIQPNSVRS